MLTVALAAFLASFAVVGAADESRPVEITVGSKKFTENVILGEIVTQLARTQGVSVRYRRELGGTRVLLAILGQCHRRQVLDCAE